MDCKKTIIALLVNGGSINLLSDTVYKRLENPSQIKISNRIVIANNEGIDL